MDLAIATNTDEELNRMLRQWISQKKLLLPHSNEDSETIVIANPNRVRTKGAPSKRIKSQLETAKKHNSNAKTAEEVADIKKVCLQ
jgi:hypothetical protein